jgi:hypothetical protein
MCEITLYKCSMTIYSDEGVFSIDPELAISNWETLLGTRTVFLQTLFECPNSCLPESSVQWTYLSIAEKFLQSMGLDPSLILYSAMPNGVQPRGIIDWSRNFQFRNSSSLDTLTFWDPALPHIPLELKFPLR